MTLKLYNHVVSLTETKKNAIKLSLKYNIKLKESFIIQIMQIKITLYVQI